MLQRRIDERTISLMDTKIFQNVDLDLDIELITDIYDKSICEKYESGKILVLDNFALLSDIDFEFIHSVEPLENNIPRLKKAKEKHIFAPLTEKGFDRHILRYYKSNFTDAKKLQDLFIDIKERFRVYLATIFPKYTVTSFETTWRFTKTQDENMHLDIYHHPETFYVRMFTNLDNAPRIWRTSYNFEEAYSLVDGSLHDVSPSNICSAINKRIFGPTINGSENHKLGYDFKYHEFHFAPGTAWLAHLQFRSHQIYYGDKMMGATLFVDANTMIDDSLWIDNLFHRNIWLKD